MLFVQVFSDKFNLINFSLRNNNKYILLTTGMIHVSQIYQYHSSKLNANRIEIALRSHGANAKQFALHQIMV
jgi:hypothetical protein